MAASAYHPELGETPDLTALFHTHHNFRTSYAVQWLASRDAEVRAAFARLRIRPRHVCRANSATHATPLQGDIFAALITSDAHDKLGAAGLRCLEMLLD